MLQKTYRYLSQDLWNFPLNEKRGLSFFGFKWLRIFYLSIRGFYQDRCSLSASSLTYYTLMSIVPIFAMVFAVARGFGYHDLLKIRLLERFPDQNAVLTEVLKFADSFLETVRGGLIAGVGVLILFFTVALLLSNLEAILNQIWRVRKFRSWKRVVGDYFVLMLISPAFFVAGSSAAIFVVNRLEVFIRVFPFSPSAIAWLVLLVNLIPYGLFWVLFTFIYLFMPNTKVHFSSAALAGLFTSCCYVLVQFIYLYFQIGVSHYGAIYGSMAALPLLLVWVQVSWFLFLFGAELCCAHQTFEEHEFGIQSEGISYSFKRLLTLWIAHLAVSKGFISKELLVKSYQIPPVLAKMILKQLLDCEILYEVKGGYVPSGQTMEMRVSDLIQILELKGENEFPFIRAEVLAPFDQILESFRKQIESSPQNTRLKHVSN